jgi:hypothetical protein
MKINMNKIARGKEIKLEISKSFTTSIGTVDAKNPVAVYIKMNSWLEVLNYDSDFNYGQIIRKLDKSIRSNLFNNLNQNEFYNDLTIVDLDIRESGISSVRRSFMNCQITLFQINNNLIDSEFMKLELTEIIKDLINEIFNKNQYFKFHKTKD